MIQWLGGDQPDEQAVALLNSYFNRAEEPADLDAESREALDKRLATILHKEQRPIRRIGTRPLRWLKYAAAVIVLTGASLYFFLQKPSVRSGAIAENNSLEYAPPGHHRAILSLADGTTVMLDSAGTGWLARQGMTTVKKVDTGRIVYQVSGASAAPIGYNTMSTPRGGEYEVTLSDGTKVWLNAGSSITYPTAFTGKQREVVLTGEAYFEVAKRAAKPFIVSTSKDRITVLGTHFNVNAYSDEAGIRTSLLEGSVRVGEKLLRPGQAYMNGLVTDTDVMQDVAWKNGLFNFDNKSLEEVMRQLSRWYDLDIVYRNKVSVKFFAEIPRNTSIEKVLKALELTGRVHFRREGKNVVVFR